MRYLSPRASGDCKYCHSKNWELSWGEWCTSTCGRTPACCPSSPARRSAEWPWRSTWRRGENCCNTSSGRKQVHDDGSTNRLFTVSIICRARVAPLIASSALAPLPSASCPRLSHLPSSGNRQIFTALNSPLQFPSKRSPCRIQPRTCLPIWDPSFRHRLAGSTSWGSSWWGRLGRDSSLVGCSWRS